MIAWAQNSKCTVCRVAFTKEMDGSCRSSNCYDKFTFDSGNLLIAVNTNILEPSLVVFKNFFFFENSSDLKKFSVESFFCFSPS